MSQQPIVYLGNASRELASVIQQQGTVPAAYKLSILKTEEDWNSISPHPKNILLLQLRGNETSSKLFPGGLEYLWALRSRQVSPFWMAVMDNEARFPEQLAELAGAQDCFLLPQDRGQLFYELEQHLEEETPEALPQRLTLFDLLMMGHLLQIDGQFLVSTSNLQGSLEMSEGELNYAHTQEESGEKALFQLLAHPWAQVELQALESPNTTNLHATFESLLRRASFLVSPEKPEEPAHQPPVEETTQMADLNSICREIIDDVDDSLACAVVDLNSGMLMGVHHNIPYFTQSYIDAVAAAAVDMFRGKSIRRVEKLISKHRGQEVKDSFQEIFINSAKVFHFMKVISSKDAVVVLVTKKSTNQGMGWRGVRAACDDIEEAM